MTEDAPSGDLAQKDLAQRLATIEKVLGAPPQIHANAPSGVWSTRRDCYQFMARELGPGSRTLETGAGVSTILFAAWGCEHLCVVPVQSQVDGLLAYCADQGIDSSHLSFDVRPSEIALPELDEGRQFELVLIDGCHGFPLPVIDWFYGAGRLRQDGVVIFDDLQLPQVSHFLDWYLERDPRWEREQANDKWAAFRRRSTGPLGELQDKQPFLGGPATPDRSGLGRLRSAVSSRLKS
jgi:hypothetical protein